ncbi:MAG: type I DNA topoisomerase, partial [Gemmataceae bacterium]|nr:type I DNA topoisomerase [Gemmataceae bacterium]
AAARRKRAATAHAPGNGDGPPPAGGRDFDLVIVESPAKAKTINKYLGPGYRVLASYGHVRDLSARKQKGEEVAGIRIADGWKLRYAVDEKSDKDGGRRRSSQSILDELGREASRANRVLLASDPDREGEAIARDIADELSLDPARTYRIRFNEITKPAIQRALQQPEGINADRVAAQEARRAMDRVVGFPLSNLLGKKVAGGLSAGRVQSVAVKLIVDREREIEAFVTEEYWKLTALLAPQGSGIAWVSDPQKSKIFAKKKPGEPSPANPERERGGDEPDEPVEDTEAPEPEENAEAPVADAPGSPDAGSSKNDKGGLPKPPAGAFLAELVKWDGADPKLPNEAAADAAVEALRGVPFVVTKVEQKDRQDRPHAPFTTSTLQQQAFLRLRMSTGRTMSAAQALYQGVDLRGQGQTALITYMRTDSTRVSPDALNAVRNFIGSAPQLGQQYLPAKPNFYASGKAAQEAHEAIRPTDVNVTPTQAAGMGLAGDQLRLYELIWRRFVASQCAPAVLGVTTYDIKAGRGLFRARGQVVKFAGYRKVLSPVGGKTDDTELPAVREGETLDRLDLFETQHFTQPPPRYNQASLVKALEKEGIGRPSTYNTILSVIQKRGYVTEEKGRFYATQIAKVVTDFLVGGFPRIMDLKFTSHFEEELDEIETGKCHYREVLDEFWGPFSDALKKAGDIPSPAREILTDEKCPKCGRPLERRFSAKTGGSFVGCTGWKEKENKCTYKRDESGKEIAGPEVTEIKCPACGRFMVKKEGRFGVFFTCEGAAECPTTMNLRADGSVAVTALPTQVTCPKCEKTKLLLKESKAGKKYVQCPDAKCKFIADADEHGNPIKPPDTGIACEKCGSPMVVKVAWRGPFLSCSGYPKCRNAKSINAELRGQLTAKGIELPAQPAKGGGGAKPDVPAVEVTDQCPECDGPMRLMKSRFGGRYFLGCTKYPKCKGTAKVSPALQARIDAAQQPAAAG